jgi:hypothetical protein
MQLQIARKTNATAIARKTNATAIARKANATAIARKANATAKVKCVAGMMALAAADGLPGFRVLPAGVGGVIEVE